MNETNIPEIIYKINIFKQGADSNAGMLLSFESRTPFMNFNVGDVIDHASSDFTENSIQDTKDGHTQICGISHFLTRKNGVQRHILDIYTKFADQKDVAEYRFKRLAKQGV
jgi:hypothetical protein